MQQTTIAIKEVPKRIEHWLAETRELAGLVGPGVLAQLFGGVVTGGVKTGVLTNGGSIEPLVIQCLGITPGVKVSGIRNFLADNGVNVSPATLKNTLAKMRDAGEIRTHGKLHAMTYWLPNARS
jgi:hypothetical protein